MRRRPRRDPLEARAREPDRSPGATPPRSWSRSRTLSPRWSRCATPTIVASEPNGGSTSDDSHGAARRGALGQVEPGRRARGRRRRLGLLHRHRHPRATRRWPHGSPATNASAPTTWQIIEEPLALSSALDRATADALVIVDCLTLWLSNQLVAGACERDVEELSSDAARRAARREAPVIAVSNEVGMGIVPADPFVRGFRDLQGRVNTTWVAHASEAYLVVAGALLPLTPAAPALAERSCGSGRAGRGGGMRRGERDAIAVLTRLCARSPARRSVSAGIRSAASACSRSPWSVSPGARAGGPASCTSRCC